MKEGSQLGSRRWNGPTAPVASDFIKDGAQISSDLVDSGGRRSIDDLVDWKVNERRDGEDGWRLDLELYDEPPLRSS